MTIVGNKELLLYLVTLTSSSLVLVRVTRYKKYLVVTIVIATVKNVFFVNVTKFETNFSFRKVITYNYF